MNFDMSGTTVNRTESSLSISVIIVIHTSCWNVTACCNNILTRLELFDKEWYNE